MCDVAQEGENMKAIFYDGTELTIQQAYIGSDGSLCIKTISATQDQLRAMFSDSVKTKRITVEERGQTLAVYEKYTVYEGTMVYAGGILEVHLQKEGETIEEKLSRVMEENKELRSECNTLAAQNAELTATLDSVLTEVLPALMAG